MTCSAAPHKLWQLSYQPDKARPPNPQGLFLRLVGSPRASIPELFRPRALAATLGSIP